MRNDANEQLIIRLFDNISNGRVAAAVGLLTDDCIWTVPDKPGKLPVAVSYQKSRYHFMFNIRGGKVSKVYEYCDTLHIREAFLD